MQCALSCQAQAVAHDLGPANPRPWRWAPWCWPRALRSMIPTKYAAYHYSKLPNVVTSLEFERILSASGPYAGHLVRPGDHQEPKKIAWLQCVGSRDIQPLRQQLLLRGLLHVRHQADGDCQGALQGIPPGHRHFLHGHADPWARSSRSTTGGPKTNTGCASSAPGFTPLTRCRAPATWPSATWRRTAN